MLSILTAPHTFAAVVGGFDPNSPAFQLPLLLITFVVIPSFFEKSLRLPGLVGLIAVGYFMGPEVINVFQDTSNEGNFLRVFSDVGLILLMFMAGLEVELEQFLKVKDRSMVFGLISFLIPFIAGLGLGFYYGYGVAASILIGSFVGSHTLVDLPTLSRQDKMGDESVVVTIGGTIITDVVSLLVLTFAVDLGNLPPGSGVNVVSILLLLVKSGIFFAVILVGLSSALKLFFKKRGCRSGDVGFLVLFASLLFSAELAHAIGIEPIVGAFLAGLATNSAIESYIKLSPNYAFGKNVRLAQERVLFLASAIFIPSFFVFLGVELQLRGLAEDPAALWIGLALTVALVATKWLASAGIQRIYNYSKAQMRTMWALSIPQVGATTAAAFVGVQVGLIDIKMLTASVILVLITSLIGPILLRKAADDLPQSPKTS
jgi:Kef-type K+ transport system membrane component KefB